MSETEKVVKRGTFFYAGQFPVEIRIVNQQWRYGTGDYEDPPEIRDDVEGDWYSINYITTTERGTFTAGGGTFPSLDEAISHCETKGGGQVSWGEADELANAT